MWCLAARQAAYNATRQAAGWGYAVPILGSLDWLSGFG